MLPRLLAVPALFAAGLALGPAIAHRTTAPAQNWVAVVAKTPEGGVRMGNPDAPIKLVEYGSRSCPTCARFAAESGALRTRYVASGKVSFEFREFLIHPQDLGGSLLGKCITDRNFFTILDQMYANQQSFNDRIMPLGEARLREIQAMPPLRAARAWSDALGYTALVRQAGMSDARIDQCFSDQAGLQALGDRLKAAVDLGVDGTPAFFLNGRRLDKVYLWSQLEPHLKAAGA